MISPLLALLVWPLISIVFFRRLRLTLAVLVTILGGFLLLSTETSRILLALPSLDKATIPTFSALVLALIFGRDDLYNDFRPTGLNPRPSIALVLLRMLVLGVAMIVVTYDPRVLLQLQIFDAASMALSALMMITFVLALRYMVDPAFLLLLYRRLNDIGMETSVLEANLEGMVSKISNIPLKWLTAGDLWGRLELQKLAFKQEAANGLMPAYEGHSWAWAYTTYQNPATKHLFTSDLPHQPQETSIEGCA